MTNGATQTKLARVVNSTVEPLSDIAQSNSWRQIEQALNQAPPAQFPLRRVLVGFVGVAAAAVVLVLAVRSSTDETPTRFSESLVADAGENIDRAWIGGELTLHGPGALELIRDGSNRLTVIVSEGAVVIRRDVSAQRQLSVRTSTLETDVTSAIFAVRVHLGATQMATGEEQLRRLLLDHELLEVRIDDLDLDDVPAEDVPDEDVAVHDAVGDDATTAAADSQLAKPKKHAKPTAKKLREINEIEEPRNETEEPRDVEPAADLDESVPLKSQSLDEIYTAAEQAMREGDSSNAVKLLEKIVREDRGGRLAPSARYDLALLAIEIKQHARALRLLDELIRSGRDPNLTKSARLLRCRVLKLQGKSCAE